MRKRIAIVYNEPVPSRYDTTGETKAVLGVLDAVQAVDEALIELGYSVTRLPLSLPSKQAKKKLENLDTDLVFNLFEGFAGYPDTEALVPETLSELKILFTGCPGASVRLCLDKARVKILLEAAGIPTPESQLLTPQLLDTFSLDYPCIVKPRGEDASHGLSEESVVNDFTSLTRQVKAVSESYGGSALVERFIDGREFNATILGKFQFLTLPIAEIVYSLPPDMPRILTFAAKWELDTPYYKGTRAICPAEIDAEEEEQINTVALAAFRLLGCQGYARVDMRADGQGRINVIEVNPNPDISPGSGAARQAATAGMTYAQFVEKIIETTLEKESVDN